MYRAREGRAGGPRGGRQYGGSAAPPPTAIRAPEQRTRCVPHGAQRHAHALLLLCGSRVVRGSHVRRRRCGLRRLLRVFPQQHCFKHRFAVPAQRAVRVDDGEVGQQLGHPAVLVVAQAQLPARGRGGRAGVRAGG